ncbi:TetR/AcrR family transcriptional regulator [Franconibacter helveticus 513]|uniref:TetR/AcrR family transcriptional regulator n=1 Tax=Franconibacter helveticus TaxID=357240 RepID=UPI00041A1C26|nr:TetR/AcrR family transcriptional regulator [Franconibacter helveticus]
MTMMNTTLKPRKTPLQARSTATVEALHTATIQVLTREGLSRCTTTRVARRAGMSVGSLYQYYPNRDALLAAVLENHLDGIATAVETVCRQQQGANTAEMARALAAAFLAAKLRDPQESRALYAVAAERGGAQQAAQAYGRMAASITAMLASASNKTFADPALIATVTLSSLIGPVRAVLEGHTPPGFEAALETQLIVLLSAWLQAAE